MSTLTLKAVLLAMIFFAQNEPKLQWLTFEKPEYPQKAQAAHIEGQVSLTFTLQAQGPVVLDKAAGNPILIAAATESLKKSEFGCTDCKNIVPKFTVIFDFQIVDRDCSDPDSDSPTQIRAEDPTHLVITVQSVCPVAPKTKKGSAKKKTA